MAPTRKGQERRGPAAAVSGGARNNISFPLLLLLLAAAVAEAFIIPPTTTTNNNNPATHHRPPARRLPSLVKAAATTTAADAADAAFPVPPRNATEGGSGGCPFHASRGEAQSASAAQQQLQLPPYAPGPIRWPLVGNMLAAQFKYGGMDKFDAAMQGGCHGWLCVCGWMCGCG
jgi:hypothetical protein